jgi:hypothetical protein
MASPSSLLANDSSPLGPLFRLVEASCGHGGRLAPTEKTKLSVAALLAAVTCTPPAAAVTYC